MSTGDLAVPGVSERERAREIERERERESERERARERARERQRERQRPVLTKGKETKDRRPNPSLS